MTTFTDNLPPVQSTGHKITAAEWNAIRATLLGVPRLLDASGTTVDVVSSVAETTLYTATVPAGLLGIHDFIEQEIVGDFFNNDTNRTFTLRAYAGGAARFADNSPTIAVDADRGPWACRLRFGNLGAVDANYFAGAFGLGNRQAGAAGAGLGNIGTADLIPMSQFGSTGTLTIDTASAFTIALTVQLSASSANLSFRKFHGATKVYPL